MPDPASPRQLDKIKELETEIISAGGAMKPMTQATLDSLTGGREGTASSLIQMLFDTRNELSETAPITEPQLKIIVEWFLCPDIPFESFSSEEVYDKKELANDNESRTITIEIDRRIALEDNLWRLMTVDEFESEIKSKLTKKRASKFIDAYRGVFYDWKKTRITESQVKYIRELELRLANITTPKAVEWAFVDGEMVEMKANTVDYNDDWNPMAYQPMDELVLAQLSYEDASKWIDNLKTELHLVKPTKKQKIEMVSIILKRLRTMTIKML